MTYISGVDGCRSGWISVERDLATGELHSSCFRSAEELIRRLVPPRVLAIDVPIGLTEHGKRTSDVEARIFLSWPRRCSVFSSPVRGLLRGFRDDMRREEASDLHQQIDGRGIGVQAWGIVKKIKEVDDLMRQEASLQSWVREVHPEASFCAWAGRPMRFNKKTRQGREGRRQLVDSYFGSGSFASIRAAYRVKEVAHDDILDAFAALWTAERVLRNAYGTFPPEPALDSVGLKMEIVY